MKAPRFSFPLAAVLVAAVAAPACYQVNVRPTQLAASQDEVTCRAYVHEDLLYRGYGPVQGVLTRHRHIDRLSGGPYALYSKDKPVLQRLRLTGPFPMVMGDLIGVRVTTGPDRGCEVELIPATYDCSASDSCQVTPGASPDVDADIARVAASFRSHFSRQ